MAPPPEDELAAPGGGGGGGTTRARAWTSTPKSADAQSGSKHGTSNTPTATSKHEPPQHMIRNLHKVAARSGRLLKRLPLPNAFTNRNTHACCAKRARPPLTDN